MKRFMFAVMAIAAISFAGCDKGENGKSNSIQLTSSNQTMYYDDEFQINATSDTPITYTSENEYHAEVSASGLVTAGRIGETNILLKNGEDTKKVKITVRPKSNLYPEPNLTFGMSRSAVKAKLGAAEIETEDGLGYGNYSTAAPRLLCIFDGFDKLSAYAVTVRISHADGIADFLLERYVLATVTDDRDVIFINSTDVYTATMSVLMYVYDLSYLMVMYSPFQATRSLPALEQTDIMKSMKELMGE